MKSRNAPIHKAALNCQPNMVKPKLGNKMRVRVAKNIIIKASDIKGAD
jgi:hypothetical protein